MPKFLAPALCLTILTLSAGCSSPEANAVEAENITLRNLTESSVAAPRRDTYPMEGDLIPTPSDPGGRYYLLRDRQPALRDTIVAVLREERGDRAAYARVEVDCKRRQFHIIGIGSRQLTAETSAQSEGPLRPIDGYPLRQDIASFVCERRGTPLTPAA